MKTKTKLNIRRFALRWLRKLFDVLEDRLHAEEVKLRNDLSGREASTSGVAASTQGKRGVEREDMLHQQPRPARGRKRGCTSSAFDSRVRALLGACEEKRSSR